MTDNRSDNNGNNNGKSDNYVVTETWHQATDTFGIQWTDFEVSFNQSSWNGKKLTEIWGDLTNCFDKVFRFDGKRQGEGDS